MSKKADELMEKKRLEKLQAEQAQAAPVPTPEPAPVVAAAPVGNQSPVAPPDKEKPPEDEENAVYGYAKIRQAKPHINFIKLDGSRRKIPYQQFINYDDFNGSLLVLTTLFCMIEIEGVNLNIIYDLIEYHRLFKLVESGTKKPIYSENGVCVFSINYTDLRLKDAEN